MVFKKPFEIYSLIDSMWKKCSYSIDERKINF